MYRIIGVYKRFLRVHVCRSYGNRGTQIMRLLYGKPYTTNNVIGRLPLFFFFFLHFKSTRHARARAARRPLQWARAKRIIQRTNFLSYRHSQGAAQDYLFRPSGDFREIRLRTSSGHIRPWYPPQSGVTLVPQSVLSRYCLPAKIVFAIPFGLFISSKHYTRRYELW